MQETSDTDIAPDKRIFKKMFVLFLNKTYARGTY